MKKIDILKRLRHDCYLPHTIHTLKDLVQDVTDHAWYAADEIEKLRNEVKQLKKLLKQNNIKA